MEKLSIIFYAINGTGLGHISRLNNIAVDAAYLCKELGLVPNFEFITTSDSPGLVGDFLVTKYPSKTTINELSLPFKKTSAKIKAQIISHINGFNPDCLVLDTNPKGSYGEFPLLREFSKSTVFIDRARKAESITTSTKKHIKLFDALIIPENKEQEASFLFHPNATHCGKVHGYKPEKSFNRSYVRKLFGVNNQNLIYISSGGGGDLKSEEQLKHIISSTLEADKTAKIVVGYGSFYKGEICYSDPRVIPFTSNGVSKYFQGFDYAVSAAGYNTFEELKASQCPSLFYSLEKGLDDQDLRIKESSSLGLCGYAQSKLTVQNIIEFRLSINSIRKNLSQLKFEHGSAYAAACLIKTTLSKRNINVTDVQLQAALDKLINLRNISNNKQIIISA